MAGPSCKPNPRKAVDDQVSRKQKHANVFGDFHNDDLLALRFGRQFKSS